MSTNGPTIRVSEAARRAIEEAAASIAAETQSAAAAPLLRVTIGERFACDLRFDTAEADDVRVDADGLTLLLDPQSVARADGLSIDFVTGPDGSGFTIDNPNAPPAVRQLSAPALARMIASGVPFILLDVRAEEEREIARIEGSRLFDRAGHDYVMSLDRNTTLVFQCHHGIRSQAAADYCLNEGFRNLYNLEGGIDAWSTLVDPAVPRY
jgi:monothiol glutaredoxin